MTATKFLLLAALATALLIHVVTDHVSAGWQTASREPVGLAPDPERTPEAIIQVYGARAYSWRGYFGVHTWIAVKPSLATAYTVYEVIGWYLRQGGSSVLAIHQQRPDRRWFGSMPVLLAEKRGDGVDALISRIEEVAHNYPYAKEYTMWPGPNSNTFVAWVSRAVPELELDLPPTAIGKDYLGSNMFSVAPSGSGWQWSFYGLLGVIISEVEGIEINLLGLTFGISPNLVAIKLPLVGRIDLSALLSTLNGLVASTSVPK
ncbi:MAG: DUF3750 domain-containing protein [Nitrosomonas communis]|nr:DUF3750 domain-containing protein [Nitrosomonas communis]